MRRRPTPERGGLSDSGFGSTVVELRCFSPMVVDLDPRAWRHEHDKGNGRWAQRRSLDRLAFGLVGFLFINEGGQLVHLGKHSNYCNLTFKADGLPALENHFCPPHKKML